MTAQNLVRNDSFENYNTPINWNSWGGDFIGYYTWPPDTVMIDWHQLNTPDFFVSACTHSFSGVPLNVFGESYAKNGNCFTGFILFAANGDMKEYIYQQLTTPLQAGKVYCLSFYVSRADRVTHAIHSIGAYFSNNEQSAATLGYVNVTPQIVNQTGFITDTIGWTQIQGCYTAIGGEQYITIGNFNSNANTDTLYVGSVNPEPGAYKYAYYYIDDITLIDQSTVGIKELGNGNSLNVYPNPANGILNIDVGHIYENTEIKIYDALGEVVLSEDLTTQNSSLNIHHLQSGIYFYTILAGEKTIKTDKIVIIK